MDDPFSLGGQVALVTGSSRGLGRSIARALAGAGAHVVVNGRDGAALGAVVKAIRDDDLAVSAVPFDVGDETAVKAAIAGIVGDFGRLDILVNNAGITFRKPYAEMETSDWQHVLDINLTAGFRLAQEAVKPMMAHGYGRIINIASVTSFIARPGIAAYVAAKHALAGLTKALAVEFAPHGITCNAIAPGYFVTDATAVLARNPEFDVMLRRRTPLGRWGEPDELGGAAIFLASRAASFVTGHVLTVDGGLTIAL